MERNEQYQNIRDTQFNQIIWWQEAESSTVYFLTTGLSDPCCAKYKVPPKIP